MTKPANLGDLIMTPAMYRRNSWFPTVFDEFLNSDLMNTVSTTAPSVNVKETEKEYIVELAAPGVKKDYCRVHIDEDHNLCVAIENKFEHKEEDKHSHYLRREFSYTNYEQKYSLPDDVNEEGINAKVEDGILTIELPKVEKVEGKTTKQIEIK
jgi:HSP20 family protein